MYNDIGFGTGSRFKTDLSQLPLDSAENAGEKVK